MGPLKASPQRTPRSQRFRIRIGTVVVDQSTYAIAKMHHVEVDEKAYCETT
jgi:hypothetical protein